MTTKDFNKQVKEICTRWNFDFKPQYEGQIRYEGSTPFGTMQVISDPSPRRKLYTIYFKFIGDFDLTGFYDYFSKHENINKYSGKWNLHYIDAECILNELDERLNNLDYISKN